MNNVSFYRYDIIIISKSIQLNIPNVGKSV